jgi:hypothetical protein
LFIVVGCYSNILQKTATNVGAKFFAPRINLEKHAHPLHQILIILFFALFFLSFFFYGKGKGPVARGKKPIM